MYMSWNAEFPIKTERVYQEDEEKNEEKNEINGQNPKKVQESAFDKYRVEGISGKIQEQSQSQTVTGEKQGQKNQEGKTEEYEDITM